MKSELTDVNDYEQLALKMRKLKALRQQQTNTINAS